MVPSSVMSAFFPTSYANTSLSKTATKTNCSTPVLFQSIQVKSVNKAIIPTVNGYKLYDEQQKPEFTLPDWKRKQTRHDMHADVFDFGRMVQDGVLNQNFQIRSYEVVADRSASIETLMNHLQETALNHARLLGFNDGFGSTPEMSKRNLIWVFTNMHLLVDRYPSWGDVVGVDTWMASLDKKNGIRREWHVRDYSSGQTILRATSLMVMINKLTRKLAKFPDKVRKELEPCFVERKLIIDEDNHELSKPVELDENNAQKYLIRGLTPRWTDHDPNEHVNNVKYIEWILESAPMEILEKQELVRMKLEYRRECGRDSIVKSLTTVYSDSTNSNRPNSMSSIHCDHHLSLEAGTTILRGRTMWRPKQVSNEGIAGSL